MNSMNPIPRTQQPQQRQQQESLDDILADLEKKN